MSVFSLTDPLLHIPGQKRMRVSEVTASAQTRAQWLAPHCGKGGDVLCLCRAEGVPMGVGHRRLPTEIYYLYPLHRLDPLRHALGCPHRSPASQAQPREDGTMRPLVEVRDGYVNVELAGSLSKIDRPVDAPPRSSPRSPTVSERSPTLPSASLSLLLEILWSQAALNHWTPGFRGRRSYNVVRRRLMDAARLIAVRRRALHRRLYIPPTFRELDRAAIDAELLQWLNLLRRRGNRQPCGFVGGLLRTLRVTDESTSFMRLMHFPRDLRLDRATFTRLDRHLQQASAYDDEVLLFVFAVTCLDERTGHLVAIDATALSLNREYLPVQSMEEVVLIEMLIEGHRRFRRPLGAEYIHAPPNTPMPCTILEDRDDRLCLEIFPAMNSAGNAERLRLRRSAYAAERQAVWWWDSHAMIEPPEIPGPTICSREPLGVAGQ
jgi:hypothetical protein